MAPEDLEELRRSVYDGVYDATDVLTLIEEVEKLQDVVEFYAEPLSWFGVALWTDPPCGDIAEDYSYSDVLTREVPGRRARVALGWEQATETLQDDEDPQ